MKPKIRNVRRAENALRKAAERRAAFMSRGPRLSFATLCAAFGGEPKRAASKAAA